MSKNTDKDYVRLGKSLETVIRRDYIDGAHGWNRFIWINLVKGLFMGVGSVLGATLVVAILIWVLSVLDNIPLIGRVFENIVRTIQKQ